MLRKTITALFFLSCLSNSVARAHFIWLDVQPTQTGQAQARCYFGELPQPGEPELIGKIAQTRAWVRNTDGHVTNLALSRSGDEKLPALITDLPVQRSASLEATCDYGVYQRGPKGVLLQYYAKHLAGDWARQDAKLARAEALRLDIVPKLAGGQLELQVFYEGKADPEREVLVFDPDGKLHELKTDEQGRAVLAAASTGRYAARAAHIEADRSGERDGKSYAQTWHYCTLTLNVPAASADLSAAELLTRARAARAVWKDFPGFRADVAVSGGDQSQSGRVAVDAAGAVSLELPDSPLRMWVDEQLSSLVQHRMPDGEVAEGRIHYADRDVVGHPLGRKIDLGDPDLESMYRIKDDVIREVNRKMGKLRFTISVLEVVRNTEGKYLPRSFTMNFFDAGSGDLKNSLGYLNQWQRVGDFDLPQTILEIGAHGGSAETKQIVFSNCRLLERK